MLAASISTSYGIYKSNGITQPSRIFMSHVVPPLLAYFSGFAAPDPTSLASPPSLACHLNNLTFCRLVGVALQVSIRQEYLFLAMGLQQAMAALNLRTLGQLLFVDGPAISRELRDAIQQSGAVSTPRVLLPSPCELKGTESLSRDVCTQLYKSKTKLEVCMYLWCVHVCVCVCVCVCVVWVLVYECCVYVLVCVWCGCWYMSVVCMCLHVYVLVYVCVCVLWLSVYLCVGMCLIGVGSYIALRGVLRPIPCDRQRLKGSGGPKPGPGGKQDYCSI